MDVGTPEQEAWVAVSKKSYRQRRVSLQRVCLSAGTVKLPKISGGKLLLRAL